MLVDLADTKQKGKLVKMFPFSVCKISKSKLQFDSK